jgi:hypothetical protein
LADSTFADFRHWMIRHSLIRHSLIRHSLIRHSLIRHSLIRHSLTVSVNRVCQTGLAVSRGIGRAPQVSNPSELWPRLEGEEVRGLTSWAVSIDGTGTASVEAVNVLPVLGVQRPPCRVGKRFRDRFVAGPGKKAKRPAGLDHLGANPAVCRGDVGCQAWRPLPCKP